MARACGECKLFDTTNGPSGSCSWGIPECKDQWSDHAQWCPLFTDQTGYQPLLECAEEDLPEWTRMEQTSMFD